MSHYRPALYVPFTSHTAAQVMLPNLTGGCDHALRTMESSNGCSSEMLQTLSSGSCRLCLHLLSPLCPTQCSFAAQYLTFSVKNPQPCLGYALLGQLLPLPHPFAYLVGMCWSSNTAFRYHTLYTIFFHISGKLILSCFVPPICYVHKSIPLTIKKAP